MSAITMTALREAATVGLGDGRSEAEGQLVRGLQALPCSPAVGAGTDVVASTNSLMLCLDPLTGDDRHG